MSFRTSFRPGDWVCLECNFHNYASRDSCHNCGRGKRPSSGADFEDGARDPLPRSTIGALVGPPATHHGVVAAAHQGVVRRWPELRAASGMLKAALGSSWCISGRFG